MKSLRQNRLIHVSLRIPASTKESLDSDASRMQISFNALAARVLSKYTSFDKIAEHLQAIPVNGPLFGQMLEDVPVEHLELVAKELGPELIKQTFAFLDLEYDLDGLIRHYFNPMSEFSGWYKFAVAGTDRTRKLMFQHPHGSKWSAFLKIYVSGIISAATGVNPRSTADHRLVTVYC
jgi:hypothetical protein